MNQKRQKEKYVDLLMNRKALVLNEEAGTFRTLLQIKGITATERPVGSYHTLFERGPF
jgi:hypothetical protein